MPVTNANAAPAAPGVYYFGVDGMADQVMFNQGTFRKYPNNLIEASGPIYIKVKQLGYGSRFTNVDKVSTDFKEVNREAITEYSSYGTVVIGWYITYKVDNLADGTHNIELGCIGNMGKVIRTNVTFNKIAPITP